MQCEYEIQVQLLEIYNEQLRDLLDNSRTHARLDIRNTERSGLNVPDAIQVWHLPIVSSSAVILRGLLSVTDDAVQTSMFVVCSEGCPVIMQHRRRIFGS